MQAALASSSSVQAAGPARAAQRAGRRPAGRASASVQHAGARRRAAWRCASGRRLCLLASPVALAALPIRYAIRSFCPSRVSAADSDLTQEDLEEQLEAFMRRQAEIESGAAARKVEPGKVLGADEVSDEVRMQGPRQSGAGNGSRAALCAVGAAALRGARQGRRSARQRRSCTTHCRACRMPSACAATWWRC